MLFCCSFDYKKPKEVTKMQGIIVLIVYALLMVGATKAFTKREDGGESFHVGHRNMGMVVSAMSIAATWI